MMIQDSSKGGVQWKQGVVICMLLHTSLLYDATPIRCTPLRLHPPLMMNTQGQLGELAGAGAAPIPGPGAGKVHINISSLKATVC